MSSENKQKESEKDNYADKIVKNANCGDNEDLVNTFAKFYVFNILKNMSDIDIFYRTFIFKTMVDSIKDTMRGMFSVKKISEMEKAIYHEAKYKEYRERNEEFQENMKLLFIADCMNKNG